MLGLYFANVKHPVLAQDPPFCIGVAYGARQGQGLLKRRARLLPAALHSADLCADPQRFHAVDPIMHQTGPRQGEIHDLFGLDRITSIYISLRQYPQQHDIVYPRQVRGV